MLHRLVKVEKNFPQPIARMKKMPTFAAAKTGKSYTASSL